MKFSRVDKGEETTISIEGVLDAVTAPEIRPTIEELVSERRYSEALEAIASIAPSLDRFFVEVLVNAPEEDLRRNRHALLSAIQREFTKIADFSEIVVEK